ncbi:hypothetical protein F7725_027213 [Dissostichus mawsoni]|uniref:Uncharacterized protein n=1 Tax=Dissostichus mawsoni TaxID=36200 RepID=A0A7J5XCA4_DISMA|nr:hypothetical protein F7725_027213 [Dissostichus mawsoni]
MQRIWQQLASSSFEEEWVALSDKPLQTGFRQRQQPGDAEALHRPFGLDSSLLTEAVRWSSKENLLGRRRATPTSSENQDISPPRTK